MHHPHHSNPQTPQNNLNAVKAHEQYDHQEQGSSTLSDLSDLSVTSFDDIQETIASDISTLQLVVKAQEILGISFEDPSNPRPLLIGILNNVTIDGGKIMAEMLNNASMCGGDRALRYVASAISVCSKLSEPDGLTALVLTWVKFFLWPFKANTSLPSGETDHSAEATPTFDDTASYLVAPASQDRTDTFKNKVLKRDGYRCILTKVWHRDHIPDPDARGFYLEGSHILKRAVAAFTPSRRYTAPATWDIIRNYANLTDDELFNMARDVDDPSNGMALELNTHKDFDNHYWILVKQAGDNTYKYEFLNRHVARPENDIIVFTDHSGQGIPLPNPKFLALHAALGRILHLTGAGDAIDLVMERYSKGGPKVPSSAKFRGPDDWSLILYHLRAYEISVH